MSDRIVETILAEWRAAEAERKLRPGDIVHDEYIARLRKEYNARLRKEYNAAVEERQAEADDLGSRPGAELAGA